MTKVFYPLIILTLLLSSGFARAQSFFDTLSEEETGGGQTQQDLVTERVKKISDSRRIFIITNDNRSFSKGDFISLVTGDELAVRALVAKTTNDGLAGIKILKIYSMKQWKLLAEGKQVRVIRGDDSFFRQAKKEDEQAQQQQEGAQIQEEEDLYDETTFLEEEGLTLDEKGQRAIKQDSVVTINYNSISGVDNAGEDVSYQQLAGSWAYQLEDNVWGEFSYGQSTINDFPASGLDTSLQNIVLRVKYAFSTPFFSITMPYVGYQILDASSEGAGEDVGQGQENQQREIELVEELKNTGPVFGVTVLKRLVPGWFIRGNLGTDQMGIGFGLEF